MLLNAKQRIFNVGCSKVLAQCIKTEISKADIKYSNTATDTQKSKKEKTCTKMLHRFKKKPITWQMLLAFHLLADSQGNEGAIWKDL
jgi:hypothetical protein